MKLQESLLCGLGPSTSASGSGHLALHDLKTGASLATYKQTSSTTHGTAVVESQKGEGGFIFSSQLDKPILNVYHFQKDQLAQRIILPEKTSCVALDNGGTLCAVGTANGRIYLWEIASGIMLNSWEAHFRRVHVLKFTANDAALISASEDSAVSVWSVTSLLDNQLQHELPTPYCNLSDHTLPVLDIVCGSGAFPDCRIVTCSRDHSVKIWDLSSPSRPLLTTFTFQYPVQMIAMDNAQRVIFAASTSGNIHRINLYKPSSERQARNSITAMAAVGGGGQGDVVRMAEDGQAEIVVDQPITTLTISFTSTLLLVGTTSGAINIYDVESHQLLRTIATHKDKGLSVIYLQCMLKPTDLQGHTTIGDGGISAKEPIPLRPVVPFQRMRDPKAREAHEVSLMIPPRLKELNRPSTDPNAELLTGQAYFIDSQSGASTRSSVGQNIASSRVAELEAEVARLRADLGKVKGINDSMWETMVNTILPKTNGTAPGVTTPEDSDVDFMAVDDVPGTAQQAAKPADGRKKARKVA